MIPRRCWTVARAERLLLTALSLVLCAACAPIESSSASLFAAHEGGVRSQSILDGLVPALPGADSGPENTDAPAESTPPAGGPETPGGALTGGAEAGGGDSPSPSTPLAETAEEASAVVPAPAPPPVFKSGDEDIDSGEYVPPGGMYLQVPVPVAAGEDEAAPAPSTVPEVGDPGAAEASTPLESDSDAGASSAEGDRGPEAADEIILGDLLRGPSSDQEGLEAIAALPRRQAALDGGPTEGSAPTSRPPCLPTSSSLLTTPARDLSMVRAWVEGGELRAELRDSDGRLYPVVQGDRVGPDGGRVVRISRNEVVVGAIGFDLEGRPVIVQEVRRLEP